MTRPPTRTSPLVLAVAAGRVGVGAAMLVAPDRFFKSESGTETLLMQTIGIRDIVIGSGACASWIRGRDGEFRRWATVGLISDSADMLLGLRSEPLVGPQGAAVASLAPVPFVAATAFGLVRHARAARRSRRA